MTDENKDAPSVGSPSEQGYSGGWSLDDFADAPIDLTSARIWRSVAEEQQTLSDVRDWLAVPEEE